MPSTDSSKSEGGDACLLGSISFSKNGCGISISSIGEEGDWVRKVLVVLLLLLTEMELERRGWEDRRARIAN